MANTNFRHPANTAIAQVKTFAITGDSTDNDEIWTLTLTKDDGTTATVSYTEDGSPTAAEIATGLFNAWNASTNPDIAAITATNTPAGSVVLTADTAGVPFNVTLADTGDGTHTETDTTANVGNNDYGTARNWSLDAVPVGTNDVLFEPGEVNVSYGLNQSGVAIADFRVFQGCKSQFGRFANGVGYYLRIDPDAFRYEGSGSLAMFDIGSAAIAPYIASFGSPSATGRHTVYLKGSAMTTLEVARGNVGLAVLDGETSTVATIRAGYLTNQSSDVDLTIGSGVTLTTLEQFGGVCLLKCAATTVTSRAGTTLTTEGSGAITTLHAHGTVYPKSTGTIGTLNAWGVVDFTRDRSAKTVSALVMKPGGKVILHSGITVTAWTGLADASSFTVEYR